MILTSLIGQLTCHTLFNQSKHRYISFHQSQMSDLLPKTVFKLLDKEFYEKSLESNAVFKSSCCEISFPTYIV